MNTHEKGLAGENAAASYLSQNGFEIIMRNWRNRFGEIDIIAQKDDFLCFIEVKSLVSGNPEMLAHVLNKNKQKRIIKTAKYFLATYRQYSSRHIRFDVLVIDTPGFPPVYHIENAFSENE
ncbi:MAG: YraN family protein [Treponemataceae bacterium]|nr:MAG: YraN family protein [Treponemataceae bacterium]